MSRHVLYMNWDGFAKYYYDIASARGLVPVIDGLKNEGVFFTNASCGIPPITNPMQTAISSGAYSQKTGNVKVYYDKTKKIVVEQRRNNAAENIVDCLHRQGKTVASVQHFTFEENGTYAGDVNRPYIFIEFSNYMIRFNELLRLYEGKPVHTGDIYTNVVTAPDFAAIYFDDLDTVGHNNGKLAPKATSETQRVENVIWRLNQMDTALGYFIDGIKQLGLYESMSFFLITDHGMTPFTFDTASVSAYNDLLSEIAACGYKYEVLKGGMSPAKETEVVLCTAGLSLMFSFTSAQPVGEINALKQRLLQKSYVGKIMNAEELKTEGCMDFCDLYISPKPPYIFKDKAMPVGANHDSLDDSSRRIFALMWGSGIKRNLVIDDSVKNVAFAPTMTALLNAEPPRDCVAKPIYEAII